MLQRNINTKNGLVNGSIGSVTAIKSILSLLNSDPYCVERVKSKFMLLKTFYVYRKQFSLIWAYAGTIHKCDRPCENQPSERKLHLLHNNEYLHL